METSNLRQGSCYDKILKENMEANLSGIVKQVLSLEISTSEEIPDDLQHTKERRPDLLKKVKDETGQEFILHIEYQGRNDKNMAYRMAEYSVMLQRNYGLPISQHMIYLGKEPLKMVTCINTTNFKFRYHAKDISKVDYRIFLDSEVVEMKLMSILANFGAAKPKAILKKLLEDTRKIVVDDLAYGKYIEQLRVLVSLRDLDQTLNETMDDLSYLFVKEKDPFYKEGITKGLNKGLTKGRTEERLKTVRNMKNAGCPISLIAKITGLTKEEINNLNAT